MGKEKKSGKCTSRIGMVYKTYLNSFQKPGALSNKTRKKWLNMMKITSNTTQTSELCDEISSQKRPYATADASTQTEEVVNFNHKPRFKEITGPKSTGDLRESRIMFKNSQLTVGDVVKMVVAFALCFGLTVKGRLQLIELLKTCAGSEFQSLKLSNYSLNKVLEFPNEVIKFIFYCRNDKCHIELISTHVKFSPRILHCRSCKRMHQLSFLSPNFFIVLDLKYQLEILLGNQKIAHSLSKTLTDVRKPHDDLCEIQDGKLYDKICQKNPNVWNLTFNINLDGAPLFSRSKKSLWALQIMINELTFRLRCLNIFLGGVMIASNEPNQILMNLYVNHFINQVNALNEKKLQLQSTIDHKIRLLKFSIVCICVDTVARPTIQNRLKFSGVFGSSYCYNRGKFIDCMKYPTNRKKCELRTHESHMRDIAIFQHMRCKEKSKGVIGVSPLTRLKTFDMVWGFPYDIAHANFLGMTKFEFELWHENFLKGRLDNNYIKFRKIEERLSGIRPIREVHKKPEPLSNQRVLKAKDWKHWLLVYSIPICLDLIPIHILEHHALLVNATYTLSQSRISHDEINEAEDALAIYVALFQEYYSEISMRNNVHMLEHFAESVRQSGPAWGTSTLPFESNIYNLKKLVNASRGAEQQISAKSVQLLTFRSVTSEMGTTEKALKFCNSLFSEEKSNTPQNFENQTTMSSGSNNHSEKLDILKYKGRVFTTISYQKSTIFDDSTVQLYSKKFFRITDIYIENGVHKMRGIELKVKHLIVGSIGMKNIWRVVCEGVSHFFSPDDIQRKMIYMRIDYKDFICSLPHYIDAD